MQESNGNGQPLNPSGVYRHPDTGEELVFQATAKFGNPGADAATRLGFQYVGPAELKEANPNGKQADLIAQPDPTLAPAADTTPGGPKSVAELQAELEAAKEREARREKALKSKSSLAAKEAKEEKAKEAPAPKAEKENQ